MATERDSVHPVGRFSRRVSRPTRLGAVRRSKLALTLAAAVTSGSLVSTCQTRVRNALVDSSRDYFLSLLDPEAIVELWVGGAEGLAESP